MNLPKFSIITPSFNQGRYIRETIDSVQNQSYPNIEHIVIDGGSTDETVSILKSYPHLQWVSESDKGQSDALNKGFAKATGDIIGWVNSDDWYPENIFHDVAQALEEHPIVMGACELRDGSGNFLELIPNRERSWFDILKYWVPYSIPTQPSIFFRREILDQVRRPDGNIFDEELFYCMDFDLWLRVCLQYPLIKRLDRVLSYYRMTEDNKTGQKTEGMPYAEPEMSRIFRRYKDVAFTVERMCSLVTLVTTDTDIGPYLTGYIEQDFPDSEMLLVIPPSLSARKKEIRKVVNEANELLRQSRKDRTIRIVDCPEENLGKMVNVSVNASAGSILVFVDDPAQLRPHLLSEVVTQCETNRIGVIASVSDSEKWTQGLSSVSHDTMDTFLKETCSPSFVAARKIALAEIDGCSEELGKEEVFLDTIRRCVEVGWSLGTIS